MRTLALRCGVMALLLTSAASFADAGIKTGFDEGVFGSYVFRGQKRGPVGLVGNAYISKDYAKAWTFTGSLFNYTMLGGRDGIADTHYGVAVNYNSRSKVWWLSGLQAQVGFTYFDRDNNPLDASFQGADNEEVFLKLHWPGKLWNTSPYVSINYDLDRVPQLNAKPRPFGRVDEVGTYVEAGLGHSFTLGKSGWTADLSGKMGFDFGRGQNTFRAAAVRTGFRYNLEKGLDLVPAVEWWIPSHKLDAKAHMFRPSASVGLQYNRTY